MTSPEQTNFDMYHPRVSVQRLPTMIPIETFDQPDGSKVTKYERTNMLGWGFQVHLKDADLVMTSSSNNRAFQLRSWCTSILSKQDITFHEAPAMGIAIVSMPKFCECDEAKKHVKLAFLKLLTDAFEKKEASTTEAASFQEKLDAKKKENQERR